ncbi:putative type IIS restriction/modification enzyme [Pseudopedobacter saltans DSM 12145]|uniref:site-specific DNA-methyltransferase (adenine-specific) n=1 Tax=Pseudopedobacter saltans (strain ATCC 51119 / DSM 12145 / JCM 21818 / CCUG 39354 / LMG 10337 / NBRC 100064 / NCIMB 13643) TaxID=762903 RepID=F0S7D0_PSESL|nr:TaqI-like C-terminal specificity domain-containing protein [Pseudopedobacter saltans]ADY51155.1 putative type IIS restriction/modification enzyme [Pseudopedobacter saltans DSM 12145]
MILKELKPRKALNKAFLKVKPNRTEIEGFKTNLITLLDRTNDTESEEFHKNLVSDFLKKTYYDPNHFINTKGRNDLVIHNGQNANSTVGVILEAKKPTNKAEMITTKKLNAKAFQELVLYYLRERITHKNLEVKHLVATNINEWFIFDATLFDRLFAQNKNLVKQFNDFEGGRLADTKTDFFYKQIAEPFIDSITSEIEFTYFNIQDFQKPLRNTDKADDNSLIALFKILSPEHLLKLPFTNDSNSLDKRFYSELLHIIGLTETKEGSKKLIERNKAGERHTGTILEDAIIQLDSLDKLNRLEKPNQFGNTQQERLFNVALELSITWINRILFLKLLEAQLITYHKGDKSFSFLNLDKIKNYDDLNSLFFQVLARKYDERNEDVKKAFEKTPYLNSSLFEPTDIEQVTLFISNLKDDKTIPIFSQTVLKDQQGKKRTGNISTLQYLFEFLDAYDFGAEGGEEIQEDNKTLINASVLGLIFEKINGYKDGSFFTPGFITMYMCRETIRKAVVQKFNETKKWNCTTLEELYDKIEDRKEANKIVNSIKICDPAVGSGHFLVSALNEMIAVKNDLKILQDRDGKRLKEYQVEVVNDELIVTDEEGELFEYNPSNKESQRIQETLFHEKQTIIENCLFGVDINSNSVKICRLRLWIELLKNAYYKNATELETLPNIDINIKCGNSLVSRFAIDADLKQALKKSKWTIDSYRIAVDTYRNAESKEQKREMERLIADIKSDFRSEISLNDPKVKKLRKLSGDLYQMTNQGQLFEMSKREKADWNKKVQQLTEETKKLETEIEEIKANKIFENAFEWRFEFPEVLNDDGDFVGFDVVIGNPPYVVVLKSTFGNNYLDFFNHNYITSEYNPNTYALFIELALSKLLKNKGQFSYIIPNSWLNGKYFTKLRAFVQNLSNRELINLKDNAFEVIVETVILISENENTAQKPILKEFADGNIFVEVNSEFEFGVNPFFELQLPDFVSRIIKSSENIKNHCLVYRGVETRNNNDYISTTKHNDLWKEILLGKDVHRYSYKYSGSYVKFVPKELKSNANIDYYLRDKILMRRTGNSIIACADYNKFIALKNLYLIIPNDLTLLPLILLQLNSKLFDFIHKSLTTGENKAFAQFPAHYVETLPCRIDNSLIEKSIKLFQQRANDESVENQIDQLVYQLYELSEEEIKIIEG